MAASLRAGLRACAEAEAVIVVLRDQPGIDPAVITRLIAAFRAGGSTTPHSSTARHRWAKAS